MKTITLTFFLTIIPFLNAFSQEELTELRQQFESAVERAVSPLEEKYKDELERLKINYMRAGKLDHANAVQREIDIKFPKFENKNTSKNKGFDFKEIENKTFEYSTVFDAIHRLTFISDDKGNGGTLAWKALNKSQPYWRVVGDKPFYKWSYADGEERTIIDFNPRGEEKNWGFAKKVIFDESLKTGIIIDYGDRKYVFKVVE